MRVGGRDKEMFKKVAAFRLCSHGLDNAHPSLPQSETNRSSDHCDSFIGCGSSHVIWWLLFDTKWPSSL